MPGTELTGATWMAFDRAQDVAVAKLRGEKVDGVKGQWLPNRCTDLFAGSPLGYPGGYLVGTYIKYRNGTGVKDDNNKDVCATGTVSAWTKCCVHYPVVFICPSHFMRLTEEGRALKLIHEALHVAGQPEDTNSTTGPGNPPNPGQLDEAVRKACF